MTFRNNSEQYFSEYPRNADRSFNVKPRWRLSVMNMRMRSRNVVGGWSRGAICSVNCIARRETMCPSSCLVRASASCAAHSGEWRRNSSSQLAQAWALFRYSALLVRCGIETSSEMNDRNEPSCSLNSCIYDHRHKGWAGDPSEGSGASPGRRRGTTPPLSEVKAAMLDGGRSFIWILGWLIRDT